MEMYNRQSEDVTLKENTIDLNQIHLDKLLASGNFGYVYKGIKFKSKGPFWYNIYKTHDGCCLKNFCIGKVISHMICHKFIPLIGWNYSIQTGVQIL